MPLGGAVPGEAVRVSSLLGYMRGKEGEGRERRRYKSIRCNRAAQELFKDRRFVRGALYISMKMALATKEDRGDTA